MESSVDKQFTDWSELELKELRDLHSKGKSIYDISQKMRRTQTEVISQLQYLGISLQSDVPKERIITKFPDLKKQLADDLPDAGDILIKIKNDTALFHQDIIALEMTTIKKFDELIAAVNENTKLKKEEVNIFKEQYAVWKQKNNPTTNIEKQNEPT